MNELALFAGAGGGLLASKLLGWNTVGAVEIEKYPRDRLLQRQDEGFLDQFPVWDDVRTFDGRPWRGLVDVISGGFPCQDISVAGKGGGLAGSRSGLWFEYQRIIEEVRPQFVFAENSPNLRTNGLDQIIEGLTGLGYDIRWGVLGAGHVGALHKRSRMWVLAYANSYPATERGEHEACSQTSGGGECQLERSGRNGWKGCSEITRKLTGMVTNTASIRQPRPGAHWNSCDTAEAGQGQTTQPQHGCFGQVWCPEPALGRVAHGVANRVDRLKAIGNGQVPAVVATAWDVLTHDLFTATVRKDGSDE